MAGPLDSLQAELGREQHKPVYLLVGTEQLLKDEALAAIKEYVFARSPRDFNFDTYDLRERQLEQALATARTFPMMGPLRLVVLRNGADLLAPDGAVKGRTKPSAGDLELLGAYLEDPEPRSLLVLLGEKVDRRRKACKQIEKVGALLEFKPLRAHELPGWVRHRAGRMDLRLDADAADLLAEAVGEDLGSVERALEKLALYVGARRRASREDVESCVARTRLHAIYEIMDAVGNRKAGLALSLVHRLLQDPEHQPIVLFNVIARQMHRVAKANALIADGVSRNEMAARLNMQSFPAGKLYDQARLFDTAQVRRAIDLLFETDRALKTSRGKPPRLLEMLVLDLCAE